MIRSVIRSGIILMFSGIVIITGCATDYTREMKPVTSDLRNDRPDLALQEFRETFQDSTGKNRLLYLMELGNLLRLTCYYTEAETVLLQADRLSDQQRGVELGQEIGAFLSSDLALDFRGADYEKIFINYCLAASYAAEDNMEDALVECRAVNNKLRAFNLAYERNNRNRYSDDAFIRYLMGILFEKSGDLNNALIAYRNSAAVYDSSYAVEYGIPAPLRVKSDILRISNELGMESVFQNYRNQWPEINDWQYQGPDASHGEIVVILEAGLIPPRVEKSYTFVFDDRIYKLALPGIAAFKRNTLSVVLSSGNNQSIGFLAEDLAAIARKNLEDQAGRDIARSIARLAVKAGVAEAGEQIVEELTSENSTISNITGFLLSLAGAATERADLRAWLTLPEQIYVARLTLPEGVQPLSVEVNGRIIFSDDAVSVTSGSINLYFLRENRPL
ncbi:MAG: hypothetical protein KAQ97_04160 [Candidatus Fermentibacteraceae bacterium]|nr:hypothetical protein [Candidatus Fermentibacteraceae bacterium]